MVDSFNEYLNEKKKANSYSSEFILSEGLFGLTGKDKEREAYGVIINFADPAVINHIAKALLNNDTFKKEEKKEGETKKPEDGSAPADGSTTTGTDTKKDPLADKDTYKKNAATIISTYIKKLAERYSKAKGRIIAKVKNDNEVIYLFKKYNDAQPKAYANSFVKLIGNMATNDTATNMAYLSEIAEVVKTTYTNREMGDKAGKGNIFNNPTAENIEQSDFVMNVTANIYNKVKERIDKNAEFAKKGNLITVFSIPYKISDESIVKIAEDLKKENSNATAGNFFDKLASVANNNIVDFLKTLNEDGLNDYLGIVPVKTYGFNLYFKDRDTAEQAAEGLNQDGTDIKVSERKRYEGKIVNRPKVLAASADINGKTLTGISGAGSWLMGTRFAVEHVVGLIGDIYPEAKTAREVKIATVKVDDDWIKNKLLNADNNTEFYMAENLKNRVIKPLVDHGRENFVSASSEGSNLVFIFTGNTSTDNIETYLNGIVPASKITIRRGSFTQGEIEGHQSLMDKLSKNFTGSKATEEETAAIREKFTSLFEAASKWIKKDQNDAQKAADAEAENAANAPDALIIQFIFDKFKKLSTQAKSNILTAIDTVQLDESFAIKLYDYLMGSLHLNEASLGPTALIKKYCKPEDVEKLAQLKASEGINGENYKKLGDKLLKAAWKKQEESRPQANPEALAAVEQGKNSNPTNPTNPKEIFIKTKNGKITYQDVIEHPEDVDSKALLTLIAVKIQTIMEVIKEKTQSKIEVKLGEDFSIIIKYQAKAKDRIVKYVNELKTKTNGIIEIKGAKNP